jgi:hypothetical protein
MCTTTPLDKSRECWYLSSFDLIREPWHLWRCVVMLGGGFYGGMPCKLSGVCVRAAAAAAAAAATGGRAAP